MMTVTIGTTGCYAWGISWGSVYWRLMVDKRLVPEDARLELINAFQKMGVKNGYGFGSECPALCLVR